MNKRNRRLLDRLFLMIKRATVTIFILGCAIVMIINKSHDNPVVKNNQKVSNEIKIEQQIVQKRADIDIQKIIYKEKVANAKSFITSVSNKAELILHTETGHITKHLDRTPNSNGFFDVCNSEINVRVDYKVVMSIPIDKIQLNVDNNGLVSVIYDERDIVIKAIETTDNTVESKKMLGKSYSDEEKQAVRELLKEKVRNEYNESKNIKIQCKKTLDETITNIAKKFKVHSIQFNNGAVNVLSSYQFKDVSNVKYGWDKTKQLTDIKYVVIHSTSSENSDSQAHIDWLNSDISSNATHFYIDDHEVLKALDINAYGWGVGNGGNGIYNGNSVHIEMCEFTDEMKQEKVFSNTIDFVNNVLLPALQAEGYNPKVVTHNDSTGKNCPRILFDNKGTELGDFIGRISY